MKTYLDIDRLDHEAEIEHKAQAVQSALVGLPVKYQSHYQDSLTPDMAQFTHPDTGKFCSIIWHKGAFCYGERDKVEISMDGEQWGHYPIAELRALVDGNV